MLQNFDEYSIEYLIGDANTIFEMQHTVPTKAFDNNIVEFLNSVSKSLLNSDEAKRFPDVITFAFWIRRASIEEMRKRFDENETGVLKRGRGIAFHIAPSNVPVNYAYSLAAGLLCGNMNIVRVPSKNFEQIMIINRSIEEQLSQNPKVKPYICLLRYGHDRRVNDWLSLIADIRIVWGGNNTINELRKSAIRERATEITFSDRFSLAVIDSEFYLKIKNKGEVAQAFYNDTYLMDQNACTSPRAVAWLGIRIDEAKQVFWANLYDYAKERYKISEIQAVNKLASGFILAANIHDVKKEISPDNLITRWKVPKLTSEVINLKDNSGYFFEYNCKDIMDLKEICNDLRCQTLSYIADVDKVIPLVNSGVLGVDRVVPVGKTMDFDLLWDGYNLYEHMTRSIVIL